MRLSLPTLVLGAMALAGCANSGSVSPLVYCDRPTDFNPTVFTDCKQHMGGDSPRRREREDRRFYENRRDRQ